MGIQANIQKTTLNVFSHYFWVLAKATLITIGFCFRNHPKSITTYGWCAEVGLDRREGAKQKGAGYRLRPGASRPAKATEEQGLEPTNCRHLKTLGGFRIVRGGWQLADIRHCILSSVLSDATEILRARRESHPDRQFDPQKHPVTPANQQRTSVISSLPDETLGP
jgi:hypothetical protein